MTILSLVLTGFAALYIGTLVAFRKAYVARRNRLEDMKYE